MISLCLTLSIICYVSRVKWTDPRKRVEPSTTPQCSGYWKGNFPIALDYGHQLYLYIYIYIYVCVCVYVWLGSCLSFKHVWLNDKNTFCLYNFIRILLSFLIRVLSSGRKLDEFTKIVRGFIFFFIVVNSSFYKTTAIIFGCQYRGELQDHIS